MPEEPPQPPVQLADQAVLDILPSREMQAKLLDCYWAFVHPHLPVLYRPWFTAQYSRTLPTNMHALGGPNTQVPAFLLLAVFALAARYCDSDEPKLAGKHWQAGDVYLEHARRLLSFEHFGSSRLTTVQGLILMAYREVGTGAMAHSWSLVGMGAHSRLIYCWWLISIQRFVWRKIWVYSETSTDGACLWLAFPMKVC